MKAEIITIGDEILIGQIVDTNSQWIGTELNKIGVSVYQITSIQDDKQHIMNALKEAENRADIIIITGGLGPTKDDITKKTISKYFNDDTVIEYTEVIEHIKLLFQKIKHPYREIQRYQAQLPSKATLLKNKFGTAPGMWFYENKTIFVSLPGIPYEMKELMKTEVLPRIKSQFKLPFIIHKTVITYGQGESIIAERIAGWANNLPEFIKLAYLPSFGKVRLRLSAKGDNKQLLEETLSTKILELNKHISDIIIGFDDDSSIEKRVGEFLKLQNKTICTAESLTGGKIASKLVSFAGSSAYYKGSFIVYSAETKKNLLDVSEKLIEKHTVVSKEVAEAMAQSARKKINTDYAIAVTGNAGPTADNNSEKVGLVYIALACESGVFSEEFDFGQPREKVINRTVNKSLEMLQKKNNQNRLTKCVIFCRFAPHIRNSTKNRQDMSRICELTGKKAMVGNNVSHALNRTKRKFDANLMVKRFYIPEENKWIRLKISASALKNINKKGIFAALKEAREKGFLKK